MSDWKVYYEDLKAFIARNPSIELTPGIICVPSDVRGEFYRLFDIVRLSIIKQDYPQMLERGQVISREWNATIRKAIDSFELQGIEMDLDTKRFLENPEDGLFRLLFDPLFDVLRGKKDFAVFEQSVPRIMREGFTKFIRDGYHSWTTLSFLELMDTDTVYAVKKSELDEDPSLHVEMAVPGLSEEVPDVVKAKNISFKQSIKMSFLVPNVIAHSQKLNSFIGFVPDFEFNEAKWLGRNLDQGRNWLGMSAIFNKFGQTNLWPDIAVYTGEHWKKLVVAADSASVAQPDIILELRTEKDWYEREGLELIRRHYEVLEPKLGCFVICIDEVPEAARNELTPKTEMKPVAGTVENEKIDAATPATKGDGAALATLAEIPPPAPDIHLLSVGFDIHKLEPIIEALLGTTAAAG